MKICVNCVLPETFPGISFDKKGLCIYCQRHALVPESKRQEDKEKYRQKFLDIAEKIRGKGEYDALMAYSGGKDSTYTLQFLVRECGLRVLAYTFDQGFISPQARENMHSVTDKLGVDHIFFIANPRSMKGAFRRSITDDVYPMKALERASAICNTCMYVAKSLILKTAIEHFIPIIAYGWSPGQAPLQSAVMRLNAPMVEKTQEMMKESLSALLGTDLSPYVLGDRHLEEMRNMAQDGDGLYNVHPLAFLEYDEKKIIDSIARLGWKAPSDTDSNSSNCLLNTFANQVHLDRYGFHPYAMENAGLVRDGHLDREEALERLNRPMDQVLADRIKKSLENS